MLCDPLSVVTVSDFIVSQFSSSLDTRNWILCTILALLSISSLMIEITYLVVGYFSSKCPTTYMIYI
ncbi:hypothetical protein QVD17_06718 [Tagetes erecta]|uniref:Uncharacterized protein n=1 Tax=Tagetes erecta TaxID=13708 RepID=A0AAD8LE54_TARER|nr:hypothetical protein QVD17_06718 [Tagetes erecta]